MFIMTKRNKITFANGIAEACTVTACHAGIAFLATLAAVIGIVLNTNARAIAVGIAFDFFAGDALTVFGKITGFTG